MGAYLDYVSAVDKGGQDAAEARSKRQAELKTQTESALEEFVSQQKSLQAKEEKGIVDRFTSWAKSLTSDDKPKIDQTQFNKAVSDSIPSGGPKPLPTNDPAFVAEINGTYYHVPTVVQGQQLSQDDAAKLFVTGKLAPIAKFKSSQEARDALPNRAPVIEAEPPPPTPSKKFMKRQEKFDTELKRGAMENAFKNQGYGILKEWAGGWAAIPEKLDAMAKNIAKITGMKSEGIFGMLAAELHKDEKAFAEKINDPTFVDELVTKVVGGTAPGVTEFVLFNPLLEGLSGAARGAATPIEKNSKVHPTTQQILNAAKEGLKDAGKRAILGKALHSVNALTVPARLGAMFAFGSSQAAAEGVTDPKELALHGSVMSAMALMGGGNRNKVTAKELFDKATEDYQRVRTEKRLKKAEKEIAGLAPAEPEVPPVKKTTKKETAPAVSPPEIKPITETKPEVKEPVKEEAPKTELNVAPENKKGPAQAVKLDPTHTPAAVSIMPDKTISAPILPPEKFTNKVKIELMEEFQNDPLPSQTFADGTTLRTPKRIWTVTDAVPTNVVRASTTRPAVRTVDGEIYEGPTVNPLSVTRPIVADLDALIQSRNLALRSAGKRGNRTVEDADGPSDIKDFGFIVTGPEGSQAAGQIVYIPDSIVDIKLVPKSARDKGITTLKDYLRTKMGDNYEKAVKAEVESEAAKAAKRNVPLTPEQTAILEKPYVQKVKNRVVNSLAAEGRDKNELLSIAEEAVIDAAKRATGKVRTPEAQQKAFGRALRGIMQNKYDESFGVSRRERKRQQKEGIQNVSYQAAGLENKPIGDEPNSSGAVSVAENTVKTKVSANTPIKQVQARADAVASGEKKPPIRTKIFSEAEKAKIAAERGKGTTPSKQGPTIPANIRAKRARENVSIIENKPLSPEEIKAKNQLSEKEFNTEKKKTKVVDESGEPMKMYHASATPITEFKEGDQPSWYSRPMSKEYGKNVYEATLDIKNPAPSLSEWMKNRDKYDGLFFKAEDYDGKPGYLARVKHPSQIKLTSSEKPVENPVVAENRRNKAWVPTDKPKTDMAFPGKSEQTKTLIGELRRDDRLVTRPNGDVTFAKYKTAEIKAKEVGGTVIPTDKGTYVVATEPQGRIQHDYDALKTVLEKTNKEPDNVPLVKVRKPKSAEPSVKEEAAATQSEADMYVDLPKPASLIDIGPVSKEASLPKDTVVVKKKVRTVKKPAVVSTRQTESVTVQTPSNLGDDITAKKKSIYEVTIVNPETNGVIDSFNSDRTRMDGLKEVRNWAKERTKEIEQPVKIIITDSKSDGPSTEHELVQVVEKGFNPIKRNPLLNESGAAVLPEGFINLVGSLKKSGQYTSDFLDKIDVERHWNRRGMAEVGFALKNVFSRRDVEEKRGMQTAQRIHGMARDTFGKELKREDLVDIVLAAEDMGHLSKLDPDHAARVKPVAAELRKYFDDSRKEFEGRGLVLDFKTRMTERLKEQWEKTADEGQKAELSTLLEEMAAADFKFAKTKEGKKLGQAIQARGKLEAKLADLEGKEFIHIPYRMIFQKKMNNFIDEADPIIRKKKYAELRSLLATKRNVTSIAELLSRKNKNGDYIVNRDDINPVNIIMNYAYNKGNDHAMLDIRDAMREQKAIFKISKGTPKESDEGFGWTKISTPKFSILMSALTKEEVKQGKRLYIRTDAIKALTEAMAMGEKQTRGEKFLSAVKMGAFYNPLFLPLYNIQQGVRSMVINPMHPIRTAKAFSKAARDVGGLRSVISTKHGEYSKDYLEALENGLASKPFGNPFESWRTFADQINNGYDSKGGPIGWAGDQFRAFASIYRQSSKLGKVTMVEPVLKSMYHASWYMSWQMDELFRMQSYNYLRAYGNTPRESAQLSSKLSGDYASIPQKTRKAMNKIFFTPTFKLATMKLYADMTKAVFKGARVSMTDPMNFKNKTTAIERRYMQAALGVFAVNFAFDFALTQGLGFERDDWYSFGRRYKKAIINDKGQKKDFYITFSSSENLPQRFLERFMKSFVVPGVPNRVTEFLKQNQWELHPVWRNAYNTITNQGPEGKIVSDTAPILEQIGKRAWFFTKKSISVLDAIQSTTGMGSDYKNVKEIRKTWIKEYGKGMGIFLNSLEGIFGTAYISNQTAVKMAYKLKAMQKSFMSEAYDMIKKTGKIDPSFVKQYQAEQKKVINMFREKLQDERKVR